MRVSTWGFGTLAWGLGAIAGLVVSGGRGVAGEESVARGRALFQREWRPHDIRAHNGDGLGPVFNERSCLACHNLGGSGGGGSARVNVEVVTPGATFVGGKAPDASPGSRLAERLRAQTGLRGFASNALHKFGTDPGYADWRAWLLRQKFEDFTLDVSTRNTPALFGAGLIDAIPDAAIEAQAGRTFPGFPEVRGRVGRLKDGTIGRFGWKGQIATLDDFVRTACAAELGLEAPGHHQSPDPSAVKDNPSDLDLTEGDCRDLVAYVATLPAPTAAVPTFPNEAERWRAGGALFKAIGCAACHTPMLGDVDGLYSDLLLHDLGVENGGLGFYSSTSPSPSPSENVPTPTGPLVDGAKPPGGVAGATSVEWRTPPLWGLRDSAPYMHDGRARDIDQAIDRHNGQASAVRDRYASLRGGQKMQLRQFLLSLSAPDDAEPLPGSMKRSRPSPSPSSRMSVTSRGTPR